MTEREVQDIPGTKRGAVVSVAFRAAGGEERAGDGDERERGSERGGVPSREVDLKQFKVERIQFGCCEGEGVCVCVCVYVCKSMFMCLCWCICCVYTMCVFFLHVALQIDNARRQIPSHS